MISIRPAFTPLIVRMERSVAAVGADEEEERAAARQSEANFDTLARYVIIPAAAVAGWFIAGAYAPVDRAVSFAGPIGGFAVKASGALMGAVAGFVGVVVYEAKTYGIH